MANANTRESPLKGIICLWSGPVDTIPVGWHLCDGLEGTPDLRNLFVIAAGDTYAPGDKGGANSHLHTATSPSHNHTITNTAHHHSMIIPSHTHTFTGDPHWHNVTVSLHSHTVSTVAHQHAFDAGVHGHDLPDGDYVAAGAGYDHVTSASQVYGNTDSASPSGSTNNVPGTGSTDSKSPGGTNAGWSLTKDTENTTPASSCGGKVVTVAVAESSNIPCFYALAYIMKL